MSLLGPITVARGMGYQDWPGLDPVSMLGPIIAARGMGYQDWPGLSHMPISKLRGWRLF